MTPTLPRVIGHRGAAQAAPENTLAAFRHAAALTVGWVELDVQLTRDRVPVVFHDDRLERTTSGSGVVRATLYDDLRRLDAGSWFSPDFAGEAVPTLTEALVVIASLGLGVNIEVKADESCAEATAIAALEAAVAVWPADRPPPLVSGFAQAALVAAARVAPRWPRGLLVATVSEDACRAARALGCVSVHADQRRLAAGDVAVVRDAGLIPLAYTVNDADRAATLWRWGVAALFSDAPDRLLSA